LLLQRQTKVPHCVLNNLKVLLKYFTGIP